MHTGESLGALRGKHHLGGAAAGGGGEHSPAVGHSVRRGPREALWGTVLSRGRVQSLWKASGDMASELTLGCQTSAAVSPRSSPVAGGQALGRGLGVDAVPWRQSCRKAGWT